MHRNKLTWLMLLLLLSHFSPCPAAIVETIGDGENRITVIYLKGQPYEMGYLHGRELKDKITALYDSLLTAASNYADLILLDVAYNQMAPYIPTAYQEEMQGLADGAGVDVTTVHRVHAIPDLSELDCTFFAAWGKATADGQLYQIRALDYATDIHLQEHPAILVYEPDDGQRFLNVGWVGFIGVISGLNYQGISISEIGDDYDKEYQTIAGKPMPFVLRDVLQYSSNLNQAIEIINNAKRTSSFLYCVGDAKIPDARSVKAGPRYCDVFSDTTSPNPFLDDVVYFSMGVASSWNTRVYHYLNPLVGTIHAETGKQLMQDLATGDLHAVVYDFSHNNLWVANADPAGLDAFRRPFVKYKLSRADSFFANYPATSVNEAVENHAYNFRLKQNYPNPFNATTLIEFEMPRSMTRNSAESNLTIYDVRGHHVVTLIQGLLTPGNYKLQWNGLDKAGHPVASGIYFYQLRTGRQQQVCRMLLMR